MLHRIAIGACSPFPQDADGTERPVGFASWTLSATEQKYSQIEKEGLACGFGVKRCHTYLYRQHFTLLTDHKSLLELFNVRRPVPTQTSGHIQHWALILGVYEYYLGFRSSTTHGNADASSHLPQPQAPEQVPEPPRGGVADGALGGVSYLGKGHHERNQTRFITV